MQGRRRRRRRLRLRRNHQSRRRQRLKLFFSLLHPVFGPLHIFLSLLPIRHDAFGLFSASFVSHPDFYRCSAGCSFGCFTRFGGQSFCGTASAFSVLLLVFFSGEGVRMDGWFITVSGWAYSRYVPRHAHFLSLSRSFLTCFSCLVCIPLPTCTMLSCVCMGFPFLLCPFSFCQCFSPPPPLLPLQ